MFPGIRQLALLLLLTGCVTISTPVGTHFSTTPPGARVLIDGEDAGLVTPCFIDLTDGDDHRVALELEGFRTAELRVRPSTSTWWVTWMDGNASSSGTLVTPFFLPAEDLFTPYHRDGGPRPERVHVRLKYVLAAE